MNRLEAHLRKVRDSGRKAFVPYFMGGVTENWLDCVRAAAFAGADAIEIGLPFSDPLLDGVVIQEAADRALGRGATFQSIMDEVTTADIAVPFIAMTYFNVFHHHGIQRSVHDLSTAGFTGAIVPDLPLEELDAWKAPMDGAGLATILLVAPSTPPDRAQRIASSSSGFCYASARMAVTGVATSEGSAESVVEKVRRGSDIPVLVGIGISTPSQAAEAVRYADGVIVGSAIVKDILAGATPSDVEQTVASFRRAIDGIG